MSISKKATRIQRKVCSTYVHRDLRTCSAECCVQDQYQVLLKASFSSCTSHGKTGEIQMNSPAEESPPFPERTRQGTSSGALATLNTVRFIPSPPWSRGRLLPAVPCESRPCFPQEASIFARPGTPTSARASHTSDPNVPYTWRSRSSSGLAIRS